MTNEQPQDRITVQIESPVILRIFRIVGLLKLLLGLGLTVGGLLVATGEPRLVLLIVGPAFGVFGSVITFLRHAAVVDRAEGVVLKRSGVGPLVSTERHESSQFKEVRLERDFTLERGNQRHRPSYEVLLGGPTGSVRLASRWGPSAAREVGHIVADFLDLPIVDELPEQSARPAARSPAADASAPDAPATPRAWPPPPVSPRLRQRVHDGELIIDLPRRGFRYDAALLLLAATTALVGFIMTGELLLGDTAFGVIAGAIVASFLLLGALMRALNRERVTISHEGLETSSAMVPFIFGPHIPAAELEVIADEDVGRYATLRFAGGVDPIVVTGHSEVCIFGGDVLSKAERTWLIDVICQTTGTGTSKPNPAAKPST